MAKLTASKKKAEPSKEFGLPEQRKYPMPDASHAQYACVFRTAISALLLPDITLDPTVYPGCRDGPSIRQRVLALWSNPVWLSDTRRILFSQALSIEDVAN